MKSFPLVAAFASLALLPWSTFAADTTAAEDTQKPHETTLVDTAKIEGQKVTHLQGQELGTIKQILVDPRNDRVRYAVIEAGKSGQATDSEIAVPFSALKIKKQANNTLTIQLDATEAKLQGAPRYKVGEAERLFSQQSAAPVYEYWEILWLDDATPAHHAAEGNGGQPTANPQATTTNSPVTGASSNSKDPNAAVPSPR
jgi:sporulation protein YlmC with PRC-barrel domain